MTKPAGHSDIVSAVLDEKVQWGWLASWRAARVELHSPRVHRKGVASNLPRHDAILSAFLVYSDDRVDL